MPVAWRWLLHHARLRCVRDLLGTGSDGGYRILVLVLAAPLVVMATVGSFFLGDALRAVVPQQAPTDVFGAWLLPGLLMLVPVRLLFQGAPRRVLGPYLHLPLSRTRLVQGRLLQSLPSLQNLLPWCVLLPFWLTDVAPAYAPGAAAAWLVAAALAVGLVHALTLMLTTGLGGRLLRLVGVLALGAALLAADVLAGPRWSLAASRWAFAEASVGWGVLALAAADAALAALLTRLLVARLRRPSAAGRRRAGHTNPVLAWLDARGLVGRLVAVELRLIARHRRTRGLVFITMPLFLALGLGIATYGADDEMLPIASLWTGLYAAGAFLMTYAAMLFGADGKHFDGLLGRDVSLRHLVTAKLRLLQGVTLALFALTLLLMPLWPLDLILAHLAWLPYLLGPFAAGAVAVGMNSRHPLDLDRSAFGYSETFHAIAIVPLILVPFVPIALAGVLESSAWLLLLAVPSAAVVSLESWWMPMLTARLRTKRHTLAERLRKEPK